MYIYVHIVYVKINYWSFYILDLHIILFISSSNLKDGNSFSDLKNTMINNLNSIRQLQFITDTIIQERWQEAML